MKNSQNHNLKYNFNSPYFQFIMFYLNVFYFQIKRNDLKSNSGEPINIDSHTQMIFILKYIYCSQQYTFQQLNCEFQ